MTLGPDTELLGNFPLEHVEGLALITHGRVGVGGITAGHQQLIIAYYSQQFDGIAVLVGEVVNNLSPVICNIKGFLTKGVKGKVGDSFSGNGNTI